MNQMTTEEVAKIKDEFIKTFLADDDPHQLDRFASLISPDCEWTLMFTLEKIRGSAAMMMFARQAVASRDHPKGLGMEFTNSFNTEDQILAEYIHRGIITGEGAKRYGVPDGSIGEVPICLVMHVKDGKIDRVHEYLNPAQTGGRQHPIFGGVIDTK